MFFLPGFQFMTGERQRPPNIC